MIKRNIPFIRHKFIWIIFGIFIIGIISRQLIDKNPAPDEIVIKKDKIETVLKDKYQTLDKNVNFIAEAYLTNNADFKNFFYSSRSPSFVESEAGYFIYYKNNLKYWSTNNIPVPVSATPGFFKKTDINLTNGWYLCNIVQRDDWFVIGLDRIKREYSYENDLIKSAFCNELQLPDKVVVTAEAVDGSIRIEYNDSGDCLYLFVNPGLIEVKTDFTLGIF